MATVRSFAKINLGLHITARRPDGYHELDTVFQTVSLYDILTITSCNDGRIMLECDDPNIPVDASNLCCRAAETLRQAVGCHSGARIRLEKRIPIGAGLGGGSSNAAAVLVALNRLWDCRLGCDKLHRLAVGIGADVPFFLTGGTARATGIGDRLEPLDCNAAQWVVLKYPDVAVSTAWAYKNLKLDLTTKCYNIYSNGLREPDIIGFAAFMGNDFEQMVFEKYPEIAECKSILRENGTGLALMSGSGSTVFGIFDAETAAHNAAAALAAVPGPVFVERFVNCAEAAN